MTTEDLKVQFTADELALRDRTRHLRAGGMRDAFTVGAEIATKNIMDRTICWLREQSPGDALVTSWLRRVTADPSHDELVAIEELNAAVDAYRAAPRVVSRADRTRPGGRMAPGGRARLPRSRVYGLSRANVFLWGQGLSRPGARYRKPRGCAGTGYAALAGFSPFQRNDGSGTAFKTADSADSGAFERPARQRKNGCFSGSAGRARDSVPGSPTFEPGVARILAV